jgi:DNA-binding Lrp family transcriptional regulator
MPRSLQFDETDLLLVNALQIAPRASWAQLHAALGIDPATLSARWQRLSQEGVAWTTCYPDPAHWNAVFAYVEVDCVPRFRDSVMAELAKDSETISIECTTGRRDLFLSVTMLDIASIDSYVAERVSAVPGVSSTRTHHVRRYYRQGADWRLHALTRAQHRRVAEAVPTVEDEPFLRYTPLDRRIVTALGLDARRSVSSLADELGVSVSAVSRRIARLTTTGRASFRCDIAHTHSPWNVITVVWISAPQDQLQRIAETMVTFPQVRQCCSLSSEANFMIQLWMRSLGELDTIEEALVTKFPTVRVLDRWVVSRTPKRLGHVIGEDGRRSGFVPVPFTESGA